jgi:hypothetical protein
MFQNLLVKRSDLHTWIHQPASDQRNPRLRFGSHRQTVRNFTHVGRLALQHSYDDPDPVRHLFSVFYMHQFSQLFVQSVVQFLATAHHRPPLVVKQPNYALLGEQ